MTELTPTQRAELERRLQARAILDARAKTAPLFYFEPWGKQLQLIEQMIEGNRIGIFTGGNRVGKTTLMAYLLMSHWLGYWVHLLPEELKKLDENGFYPVRDRIPREYWVRRCDGLPLRKNGRLLLATTGLAIDKGIAAILWPKIESMLTPEMKKKIKPKRGALSTPVLWSHPDYATLRMGSQRQGPMEFEGAAYDFIAIDEPIQKAVFTAAWRGAIDHLAGLYMGFTPLGEDAPWVYKEFIAADREDVVHITAAQSENPHLDAKALADFEAGVDFTEEELQARKFGRFGFLSHRAFPTFDPAVHVIKTFRPPPTWPIRMATDPANRRPFFCLWMAYDSVNETWIVYDEWPNTPYMRIRSSQMSVLDYCNMFRVKEADRGQEVWDRKLDPRFGVSEYSLKNEKHSSLVDDFAAYGIYFDTNIPDIARIETGIIKIRELLAFHMDPEGRIYHKPKLLVTANCINTIEALMNYAFVPPHQREEHRLDEKTLEAHKDVIDALRYAILPGPPIDYRLLDTHRSRYNDPLAQENATWDDSLY